MTELLKIFNLDTEDRVMAALVRSPLEHFACYPQIIDKGTNVFYLCTTLEEGPPHDTSSIYVWVKGVRMSFHFREGKLDHILAPTTSMVRL